MFKFAALSGGVGILIYFVLHFFVPEAPVIPTEKFVSVFAAAPGIFYSIFSTWAKTTFGSGSNLFFSTSGQHFDIPTTIGYFTLFIPQFLAFFVFGFLVDLVFQIFFGKKYRAYFK